MIEVRFNMEINLGKDEDNQVLRSVINAIANDVREAIQKTLNPLVAVTQVTRTGDSKVPPPNQW